MLTQTSPQYSRKNHDLASSFNVEADLINSIIAVLDPGQKVTPRQSKSYKPSRVAREPYGSLFPNLTQVEPTRKLFYTGIGSDFSTVVGLESTIFADLSGAIFPKLPPKLIAIFFPFESERPNLFHISSPKRKHMYTRMHSRWRFVGRSRTAFTIISGRCLHGRLG